MRPELLSVILTRAFGRTPDFLTDTIVLNGIRVTQDRFQTEPAEVRWAGLGYAWIIRS